MSISDGDSFVMYIDAFRGWSRVLERRAVQLVLGRRMAALIILGSFVVILPGCNTSPKLPEKGTKAYADVVSAFYVGLAALQVGDDVHAESKLSEVTQLVPAEPAGWGNWGVLALR